MIFLTVGTQLPFDRLVTIVDEWASSSGVSVFAQVGPTKKVFNNIEWRDFIDPDEFDKYFESASLVVAHAGMGSILSALSYGKPIVVFPRVAAFGEHRNDHQLATARRFAENEDVDVAFEEVDLIRYLCEFDFTKKVDARKRYESAPRVFIDRLRGIVLE